MVKMKAKADSVDLFCSNLLDSSSVDKLQFSLG